MAPTHPPTHPPAPLQARLKVRDLVTLRALPYPALKVSKRLAVGDSSWGVRLRCAGPHTRVRPRALAIALAHALHASRPTLTFTHRHRSPHAAALAAAARAAPRRLPPQLRVPAGRAGHVLQAARAPDAGHRQHGLQRRAADAGGVRARGGVQGARPACRAAGADGPGPESRAAVDARGCCPRWLLPTVAAAPCIPFPPPTSPPLLVPASLPRPSSLPPAHH